MKSVSQMLRESKQKKLAKKTADIADEIRRAVSIEQVVRILPGSLGWPQFDVDLFNALADDLDANPISKDWTTIAGKYPDGDISPIVVATNGQGAWSAFVEANQIFIEYYTKELKDGKISAEDALYNQKHIYEVCEGIRKQIEAEQGIKLVGDIVLPS